MNQKEGQPSNVIKFEPKNEINKTPICEWVTPNIDEINCVKKGLHEKRYIDSDIFPYILSYSNNDFNLSNSHAELLSMCVGEQITNQIFGYNIFRNNDEGKIKIAFPFDRGKISLNNITKILQKGIIDTNLIIKGLESKKIIPELPELK